MPSAWVNLLLLALLKPLCGTLEDHQVVSQNAEQTFSLLRSVVSGPQGRTEPSLVTADDALGLPTLPIDALQKAAFHLPPIFGFGPPTARVAPVQGNDRAANPQFLAAEPVVAFAVITRVAQQPGEVKVTNGLAHGRGKLRVVIARSADHVRAGDQVRLGVADQRELGPAATPKTAETATIDEVGADVMAFQAGGVDGPFGLGGQQPQFAGTSENGLQQSGKSPFFSRRSSA